MLDDLHHGKNYEFRSTFTPYQKWGCHFACRERTTMPIKWHPQGIIFYFRNVFDNQKQTKILTITSQSEIKYDW